MPASPPRPRRPRFRAPPPTPIKTAKGSRSAAVDDRVLADYLESSLRVPDLALPPLRSSAAPPEELPLPSLLRPSAAALRRAASDSGGFSIPAAASSASAEEVRSAVEAGKGVFGIGEETKREMERWFRRRDVVGEEFYCYRHLPGSADAEAEAEADRMLEAALPGSYRALRFWLDRWAGEMTLSARFPSIYNAVTFKKVRVCDCFGQDGWEWGKILHGFAPTTQLDLLERHEITLLLDTLAIHRRDDEARWRWSSSEQFSVKSTYNFLVDGGVRDTRFSLLWKIKAPLKVKVFGWLLLRCRLLTMDNLLKRGWTGADTCVLCAKEQETGGHLFVSCEFTRALLHCFLLNKRVLSRGASVWHLWEGSSEMVGVQRRRELSLILSCWWAVWKERNRRIFQEKQRPLALLLAEIRECGSLWLEHCC